MKTAKHHKNLLKRTINITYNDIFNKHDLSVFMQIGT